MRIGHEGFITQKNPAYGCRDCLRIRCQKCGFSVLRTNEGGKLVRRVSKRYVAAGAMANRCEPLPLVSEQRRDSRAKTAVATSTSGAAKRSSRRRARGTELLAQPRACFLPETREPLAVVLGRFRAAKLPQPGPSRQSSSQQDKVPLITLAQVIASARTRESCLSVETAGYIVLAVAESAIRRPVVLRASHVILTVPGDVRVTSLRPCTDLVQVVRSVVQVFVDLLAVSVGKSPGLEACADQARHHDLPWMIARLEAALIPLNHAAAQRNIARLRREVQRAIGKNPALQQPVESPAETSCQASSTSSSAAVRTVVPAEQTSFEALVAVSNDLAIRENTNTADVCHQPAAVATPGLPEPAIVQEPSPTCPQGHAPDYLEFLEELPSAANAEPVFSDFSLGTSPELDPKPTTIVPPLHEPQPLILPESSTAVFGLFTTPSPSETLDGADSCGEFPAKWIVEMGRPRSSQGTGYSAEDCEERPDVAEDCEERLDAMVLESPEADTTGNFPVANVPGMQGNLTPLWGSCIKREKACPQWAIRREGVEAHGPVLFGRHPTGDWPQQPGHGLYRFDSTQPILLTAIDHLGWYASEDPLGTYEPPEVMGDASLDFGEFPALPYRGFPDVLEPAQQASMPLPFINDSSVSKGADSLFGSSVDTLPERTDPIDATPWCESPVAYAASLPERFAVVAKSTDERELSPLRREVFTLNEPLLEGLSATDTARQKMDVEELDTPMQQPSEWLANSTDADAETTAACAAEVDHDVDAEAKQEHRFAMAVGKRQGWDSDVYAPPQRPKRAVAVSAALFVLALLALASLYVAFPGLLIGTGGP